MGESGGGGAVHFVVDGSGQFPCQQIHVCILRLDIGLKAPIYTYLLVPGLQVIYLHIPFVLFLFW